MNEINFLPVSFLRQRAQRRRALVHVAAVTLAVLTGAAFWSAQMIQTGKVRQRVEAMEAEAQAVHRQQTESARLITEYKSLLHETQVQRELAQPVTQTQVLAVLGHVLPKTVSLVQIEVSAVRPTPAPLEDAAKPKSKGKQQAEAAPEPQYLDVTLQGLAPDDLTVANVVGLLSDHPLFGQVRMRHSRATDVRGLTMRNFELTMRVDLQRDIQPRREEVAYAY